uniref:AIG1-type G domain-containing protein n=1 Tax=Myotis lucifugus TaxID=59463 RepID=G1PZ55_MYOLU
VPGQSGTTLRIVLVGKTGTQTTTANTILGRKEFDSKISALAFTKSCHKPEQHWKGRNILVVDTPGLFDSEDKLMYTCEEIGKCVLQSYPRPHTIILVLQLDRYTKEEQNTVELIKAIFGESAMKHMIVLFTRKDELGDQTLNDFLKGAGNLQSIIQECGNCRCAFNNKESIEKAEKEAQLKELVHLIEKMVRENGGSHFSPPIYENVMEKLQHETEALKIIYEGELEEETKSVEEKCAQGKISKHVMEKEKLMLSQTYNEKIKNIREEAERNIFQDVVNMVWDVLSEIWNMFW